MNDAVRLVCAIVMAQNPLRPDEASQPTPVPSYPTILIRGVVYTASIEEH